MSNIARKLFQQNPAKVFEHPTDLPTDIKNIPLGKLEGWLCMGPALRGDQSNVIGPFVPEIVKAYEDRNYLLIKCGDSEFWYAANDVEKTARPDRPCWYQSGSTLRFWQGTIS